MTTTGQEPTEEGKKPEAEQPVIDKDKDTNKDEPENFSRDYVQELRQEAAKYRTELKQLQEAEAERQKKAKEAEEKRLESQKEFETLAAERKQELEQANGTIEDYKGQLERQTAVLTALYEARKTAVPEMYQPLLDKLDLVDRLQWIADNEAKLKPANGANGIPATPVPKGMGELTPEQKRAKAKRTW